MTRPAHVVLVDDDSDIRMLATLALEHDGHTVEATGDGHRALELIWGRVAAGVRPVVVLDVQMPELDGWELLVRLREDTDTAHVPVVMCTGRTGELDRERGFGLGADAYLAKPFALDDLAGVVRRLHDLDHDDLLAKRHGLAEYLAGADDEDAPGERREL